MGTRNPARSNKILKAAASVEGFKSMFPERKAFRENLSNNLIPSKCIMSGTAKSRVDITVQIIIFPDLVEIHRISIIIRIAVRYLIKNRVIMYRRIVPDTMESFNSGRLASGAAILCKPNCCAAEMTSGK